MAVEKIVDVDSDAASVITMPHQSGQNVPFWFGITNKRWISWKFLLFFKNGAMGALLPYMVVYLRARHLAPSQIGLIECLVPFIGAISRPIIAQIADKTNRHKLVMAICILLYSLLGLSLFFIRPPSEPLFPVYSVDFHYGCSNGTFKVSSCNSSTNSVLSNISLISPLVHLTTPNGGGSFRKNLPIADRCNSIGNVCKLHCKNYDTLLGVASSSGTLLAMEEASSDSQQCQTFFGEFADSKAINGEKMAAKCASNQSEVLHCELDCYCSSNRSTIDKNAVFVDSKSPLTRTQTFIAILVLRLLGAVFFAPVFSLEDSIIYNVLGPQYRQFWGQQKMFGNFSMGLFAFLVGILIDSTSFDTVFLVYGILNIAAVIVAFMWIPQPKSTQRQHGIELPEKNFCGALKQLCAEPLFLVAGLVALASGIFIGIQFVIWPQWVLHLGASNTLIGVTTVVGSTVESIGFFFAGIVVRRFGEVGCFLAMFVAYSARFAAYSFFTPALVWLSLPLELAQLFCFSFFLGALTQYAASIAPDGMSATVQAILQACYFGFGLGIGILSSGAIFEKLGGALTFQIYAATSGVCFILLLILHFTFLRRFLSKRKSTKKLPDTDGTSSMTMQQKDDIDTASSRLEQQQETLLEQQHV